MKTYSKIPKICSSNPKFFRSIPLNPSSILWHYPFKMISFTEMKVFSKKAFPISRKNNRGCDWLLYFPLTKKKGRVLKMKSHVCIVSEIIYFYRFKFEQQLYTVTINLSWDQLPYICTYTVCPCNQVLTKAVLYPNPSLWERGNNFPNPKVGVGTAFFPTQGGDCRLGTVFFPNSSLGLNLSCWWWRQSGLWPKV